MFCPETKNQTLGDLQFTFMLPIKDHLTYRVKYVWVRRRRRYICPFYVRFLKLSQEEKRKEDERKQKKAERKAMMARQKQKRMLDERNQNEEIKMKAITAKRERKLEYEAKLEVEANDLLLLDLEDEVQPFNDWVNSREEQRNSKSSAPLQSYLSTPS